VWDWFSKQTDTQKHKNYTKLSTQFRFERDWKALVKFLFVNILFMFWIKK
jgi:hypothetical protein